MLKFSFFQGFNDSERLLYKAVVYSNIVQSMLAILRAMKDFDIPYEDDSLEHTASRFFEEAEGKSKKKHRPREGPRPRGLILLMWWFLKKGPKTTIRTPKTLISPLIYTVLRNPVGRPVYQ